MGTKRKPLFFKISSTFIWNCHVTFLMFVLSIAINHIKHTIMLSLFVLPNFKGTKKEFAEALFLCVCFDAVIVLFALNF